MLFYVAALTCLGAVRAMYYLPGVLPHSYEDKESVKPWDLIKLIISMYIQ